MRILFVHQNFPGQYKHLAKILADQGHHVLALCDERLVSHAQSAFPKIKVIGYPSPQEPALGTHRYLRDATWAIRRGQAVARLLIQIKNQDWRPDVVYVHTGWGEALFIKEVFPATKVVGYFEYYYHTSGTDVNFDPEFPVSFDDIFRIKVKNTVNLLSMEVCDIGITPTRWQQSQYPTHYQPQIHVIHEGIDTTVLQPKQISGLQLADGRVLISQATPIITFVNRNFEPSRGFHIMMRALPFLQTQVPYAHVVMVGGDNPGYGLPHSSGKTYREVLTEELGDKVDWSKIHFVGDLAYPQFIDLLQAATVHVYWTIPFVLSWSLLEAMALGKAIVASDTPPVREVLIDRKTGVLSPFFEPAQLAINIVELVCNPTLREELGNAARQHVIEHYDLQHVCLPAHMALLNQIVGSPSPK